jgi:SGNH domain (fused to AT3 domains)
MVSSRHARLEQQRTSPVRVLKIFRLLSAMVLLQVLAVFIPSHAFAAATPSSGPSLTQLISYVKASSELKQGPNVLTSLPTLTAAANDGTSAIIPDECVNDSTAPTPLPTDVATACAFGDKTATRTIFLFGDSQAQMWVPAFNVVGSMLQWKIVFVAKDGCGPWISPVTSIEGSSACNQWVHGEIALANQLKPQVVIPVGLTIAELSNGQYPSMNEFVSEIQSMVQGLKPSHAQILLLQEIPQFYSSFTSATPESCLTIHISSIDNCEVTVKQVKDLANEIALNEIAKYDHLDILPIRELFCGKQRCDVFVNSPGASHLVYQDWAHMNATYSAWIGTATAQLLSKYLPK